MAAGEGENEPMEKVNTLTVAGCRLLKQVEQVERDLGECESGRMNNAVSALTAVVKAMLLNTQPVWEYADPTLVRAVPAE